MKVAEIWKPENDAGDQGSWRSLTMSRLEP